MHDTVFNSINTLIQNRNRQEECYERQKEYLIANGQYKCSGYMELFTDNLCKDCMGCKYINIRSMITNVLHDTIDQQADNFKGLLNEINKQPKKVRGIFCLNSSCVNYFEDNCMKLFETDTINISEDGRCLDYEQGRHCGYDDIPDTSGGN